MILFIFSFIKIIIFLFILIYVLYKMQKLLPKKKTLLLGVFITLFAVILNKNVNLIPPLTEPITLIATGTKQDAAKGAEVYFREYIVDNKHFICGKSLEIIKGHWFWSGETYCWRPETDPRKPNGITKNITVNIPVGEKRCLNFEGNIYRGEVIICTKNDTWTVDTFSDENFIKSVEIGPSRNSLLILNQLRYLTVYVGLLIVLALIIVISVKNPICSTKKSANTWLISKARKMPYTIISLMTFGCMLYYSEKISLWSDELAQISFVCGTIKEAIYNCLTMDEVSPPLPSICYTLWYHVTPYGDRWILFIPILLTSISIYIIGLTGEKLRGKYCGIFCTVLMASSLTAWLNVAYEFRAYCFLVFFSTLTLYCYIKRNIDNSRKKWKWIFSLAITGLAMSHYFGMIACAFFFIEDIYFVLKKRLSFKELFNIYLFPGILSVTWLAFVYNTILKIGSPKGNVNWQPIPNFSHIQSLLQFISGNFDFTYWILILGLLFPIGYFIQKQECDYRGKDLYRKFSIVMILGSILLLFVYGNFINRKNTMWHNRYFLFLLPQVYLLSALILDDISLVIYNIRESSYIRRCITFFICGALALNCLAASPTFKSTQPYQEAADWIYGQSNYIYNPDTAIIATSRYAKGWDKYYITRKGRRDHLNVLSQYDLTEKEILKYNKIYLQYSHGSISEPLQTVLNQYYKQETDKTDIKVKIYSRNK